MVGSAFSASSVRIPPCTNPQLIDSSMYIVCFARKSSFKQGANIRQMFLLLREACATPPETLESLAARRKRDLSALVQIAS